MNKFWKVVMPPNSIKWPNIRYYFLSIFFSLLFFSLIFSASFFPFHIFFSTPLLLLFNLPFPYFFLPPSPPLLLLLFNHLSSLTSSSLQLLPSLVLPFICHLLFCSTASTSFSSVQPLLFILLFSSSASSPFSSFL